MTRLTPTLVPSVGHDISWDRMRVAAETSQLLALPRSRADHLRALDITFFGDRCGGRHAVLHAKFGLHEKGLTPN